MESDGREAHLRGVEGGHGEVCEELGDEEEPREQHALLAATVGVALLCAQRGAPHEAEEAEGGVGEGERGEAFGVEALMEGDDGEGVDEEEVEDGDAVEGIEDVSKGDALGVRLLKEAKAARLRVGGGARERGKAR